MVWLHNLLEHSDYEVIGKFSKFDKKAMMNFLMRYSSNHQLRRLIELRKFERKLENLSPHVFKKIDRLTYLEVLQRQLKVMDATAISLAMDNSMPIIVFNLTERGHIKRVVMCEPVGTIVEGEDHG